MMSLILLACKGADLDSPDPQDSPVDSAPQGPSLPGTTERPDDTPLTVDMTLAAVRIHFGEGPLLAETLAFGRPDDAGAFQLGLPLAPPDTLALSRMDESLVGALYAIVAFQDQDGDRAFTEGEPMLGTSFDRLLVWLEGEPAPGYPTGWSLVDSGFGGQYEPNRCRLDSSEPLTWRAAEGYPTFFGLEEGVPLRLSGLEVDLRVGGSVPDAEDGVFGVVGLPYQAFSGGVSAPVFTVPVVGQRFEATLTEPPPESHNVGNDPDWAYTYHLNLLYRDLDQDGVFGTDEPAEGTTTCLGDQQVYTRFTRPVHSWRGYRFLDCYDGTVGWRNVRVDPESSAVIYLSAEESMSLVMDHDTCRVFE